MPAFFIPALTLFQREVWRFVRQKNRIVGALGTPLVFWLLIGSGLKNSFHLPDVESNSALHMDYLQYFFPGTIVLILLFTSIFSTISIIEDRREGFLQGVLVAPISRSAIVLGHLLGGTLLATLQGILFLLAAPLVGISLTFGSFLFVVAVIFFMSFGLTGLGFLIAWRLDSTQGFHAIMNLFLMPLWLLSGALFPPEGAPRWLHQLMVLNPLTYSVSALHTGLFTDAGTIARGLPSPGFSLFLTILFAAVMFALASAVTSKTRTV